MAVFELWQWARGFTDDRKQPEAIIPYRFDKDLTSKTPVSSFSAFSRDEFIMWPSPGLLEDFCPPSAAGDSRHFPRLIFVPLLQPNIVGHRQSRKCRGGKNFYIHFCHIGIPKGPPLTTTLD